jgi:uncharacterized membrane protein HdeD (DUF308 family)
MSYAEPSSPIARASGFLTLEGALSVLFGLAALLFPVMAGVATAVLLGWILVACGVAGLAGTITNRHHVQVAWSLASSLLALVAGLVIAFQPLVGVALLIGVVAAWLALDGVSSLMIALDLRRKGRRGWAWMMASAVVDWILAAGVFFLGPLFGLVAVGVIVGIDLVVGGAALLTLAPALRRQA